MAALFLLAGLPSAASAAGDAIVPPGNSAADQYTESYPSGGGNRAADKAASRNPERVLGHEQAKRLQARGADGEAAAALAATTAPLYGGAAAGGSSGGGSAAARSDGDPAGGGGAALGHVFGAATGLSGSDGPAVLLTLALLATALWALAYAWRRRVRSAG